MIFHEIIQLCYEYITKIIDNTFCRFSTVGGFIFADQFLQISSLLPSWNIYGIGEHRSSLKLNTNWQSFTLFNKDQPPTENVSNLTLIILSYSVERILSSLF